MPNWLVHLSFVLPFVVGWLLGGFITDLDHTWLFGNSCSLEDTVRVEAGCSPNGIPLHDPRPWLFFLAVCVSALFHIFLDNWFWRF